MTVNLYNVLTVIAAIWVVTLLFSIFSDDIAATLAILMTLLSCGLLLYRAGEFLKLIIGG